MDNMFNSVQLNMRSSRRGCSATVTSTVSSKMFTALQTVHYNQPHMRLNIVYGKSFKFFYEPEALRITCYGFA